MSQRWYDRYRHEEQVFLKHVGAAAPRACPSCRSPHVEVHYLVGGRAYPPWLVCTGCRLRVEIDGEDSKTEVAYQLIKLIERWNELPRNSS